MNELSSEEFEACIKAVNRYAKEPFPRSIELWVDEDYRRFWLTLEAIERQFLGMIEPIKGMLEALWPRILRLGEVCGRALREAGWRWNEEIEEWIPPVGTGE